MGRTWAWWARLAAAVGVVGGVFVSGATSIEPVGAIGTGALRQLEFLPDGHVLRVLADRIEIVDPDFETVVDLPPFYVPV